jgi:hypothetical protein
MLRIKFLVILQNPPPKPSKEGKCDKSRYRSSSWEFDIKRRDNSLFRDIKEWV